MKNKHASFSKTQTRSIGSIGFACFELLYTVSTTFCFRIYSCCACKTSRL